MTNCRKEFVWKVVLLLALPVVLGGCWTYIDEEARQKFEARQERFSVTVYPVNVVKGPAIESDDALARRVVAFLRQEKLADSVLGEAPMDIPFKWGANEAKMAQQSATAFASRIEKVPVETQYALFAEILCDEGETKVFGVHYYLADRTGLVANGGLTNSHWDEFKEVQPRDRNGGYEVLVRMLRKAWKKG